jgi:uncharacterized membrane protein
MAGLRRVTETRNGPRTCATVSAMSHSHSGPPQTPSVLAARLVVGAAVVALLATLVGLALLRPQAGATARLSGLTLIDAEYRGRVEESVLRDCSGAGGPPRAGDAVCLNVTVQLLAGPDEGTTTLLVLPDDPSTPDLAHGDIVVLAYRTSAQPGFEYSLLDRERKPVLFWLSVLFALAVVLLGRLRGLAALVGLVVTLIVLLSFVLPAIISGRSPVAVAIVGGAAVTFVTLYLAHGFSFRTTTALLGTLSSLGVTAILAWIFVGLSKLAGFASEEAVLLKLEVGSLDISGLVLAGVIIGALGALDDVTVTQASAIWELRAANSELGARDLFRSGLRIGRDHIASTVNTLLLAYAGASLPLLLFFVTSQQSLASVANQEIVATEIVRTLVGSIGLVCSVPLTTWLAARIAATAEPATAEGVRRPRIRRWSRDTSRPRTGRAPG